MRSSTSSTCATATSGQNPLLSRFVGAFSPGWPTGTNDSGLKLVPVGPRTGTEEGPRGQARSEGGRGHWSRLIGRTGTKEAALFLIFFIFFIFCVLYSIKWYHIHIIKSNNEGTTIYITHYHHEYIIYIHHLIPRAWSNMYYTNAILPTRVRSKFTSVLDHRWSSKK